MTNKLNYDEVGFKAGLEIHQQLAGTKLFCQCPAQIREDPSHFIIQRKLRASIGESGTVDVAAKQAEQKQKTFTYHGYQDTTCLVEIDEEPITAPDPHSVETAVIVAKLFDMQLVDTVHIMRKVVVDGSNTSAFQRTMLISREGKIGDVGIDQICLEEDSAKILKRTPSEDIYNLSRLGIPLLEITTKPDITSPEHLKQTAANIGMVLRSTRRVKRGLGTIRQDVNISIAGGSRVEIKGVQDLDTMPLLAENEVRRQLGLLKCKNEFPSLSLQEPLLLSEGFSHVNNWITKQLDLGSHVIGCKIVNAQQLLGTELFPNYRVGTELSGYAKAWGFGGIIHGDEKPEKYGLSNWDTVREILKVSDEDGFLLLVGDEDKARFFLSTVLKDRITQLSHEVPSEVRKALPDGSTRYLRPMPGNARMYPETDAYPFRIDAVDVELPELLITKIPRLAKEYGVKKEIIASLIKSDRLDIFEKWTGQVPASVVADILVVKEKEMKRRHNVDVHIDEVAEEILYRIEQDTIAKDTVEQILLMYAKKGSITWESFTPMSDETIEKVVKEVVKQNPNASFGALMGDVMKKLSSGADGKRVSLAIRKELA